MHGGDGNVGGGIEERGGGIIEFRPFIPASVTGFIEINYSPRPRAQLGDSSHFSSMTSRTATSATGRKSGWPDKRGNRTGTDAIAAVVVLRLINFKVIILQWARCGDPPPPPGGERDGAGCGGGGVDKQNNAGGDIQMFPGQTNNKG